MSKLTTAEAMKLIEAYANEPGAGLRSDIRDYLTQLLDHESKASYALGYLEATQLQPTEPVAWMFTVRAAKGGRCDTFAAIDWSPDADDDRVLVSKEPLAYAHPPVQPTDDEVEAMCERLETNDDDVSYTEVVALLRKQAAQIAELQAKAQVQYGELIGGDDRRDAERYRWLRASPKKNNLLLAYRIDALDRVIDAAMTEELDAYMTEYKPGQIANND